MSTKTISITEDAYDRLRSLKETERMSFSEVIIKYYPKKRPLSETLAEISRGGGADELADLADQIERASGELRSARLRAVDL
jgi:predicted CopG family antitoxin